LTGLPIPPIYSHHILKVAKRIARIGILAYLDYFRFPFPRSRSSATYFDNSITRQGGFKPSSLFFVMMILLLGVLFAACAQAPLPTVDLPEPSPSYTVNASPSPSITASSTPTSTNTVSPTSTESPIPTSTAAPTNTATPIPTYVVLRGEVNVEHVSCFYGPSKAYLYKYGLVGGSNLEIIGIMLDTQYIEVRAIGGDNPCWMNLQWMTVTGDIQNVRPVDPSDVVLPQSPYYGALNSVAASRSGSTVTISWDPLYLRAGDDSEQEPYLVETWVCQEGKLTFVPIGAYQAQASVVDEPGCNQPSHGRVYGVEKHGYTRYLEIPWP
jgi:hypothetical protein